MLDNFSEYLQSQGRAPATVKGYRADLAAFSRWFEQSNGTYATGGEALAPQGEAFVGAVTPTDIREYKQFLMTNKKASPATVNRHLAAIRAWIAWARANGLTDYNPANGVKDVEQQKLAPQWLDKRQQAALLKELERDLAAARTESANRQAVRDQAMVVLFLNTGLRVSELCSLELGSITISERKGEIHVMGKGEKARIIPLNNAARSVLSEWLNLRPEGRKQAFVGKKGEPLTPSGVHRRLSELGRRAGIDLSAHTLRHTFAKNLVDAGVTLEKVASLLGHSSLDTTRVYTTPGKADLEKAVRALDD